jgi:hypothetical protein
MSSKMIVSWPSFIASLTVTELSSRRTMVNVSWPLFYASNSAPKINERSLTNFPVPRKQVSSPVTARSASRELERMSWQRSYRGLVIPKIGSFIGSTVMLAAENPPSVRALRSIVSHMASLVAASSVPETSKTEAAWISSFQHWRSTSHIVTRHSEML